MRTNPGRGWEIACEEQHRLYRKHRQAVIWKTEPHRNAQGVYVGKGPVDFLGCLTDGRFVAFDAKHTNLTTRWDLSNLKPHQARDLEAVGSLGGVAFVLLRFRGVGRFLPWSEIREAWQDPDRGSLTGEELEGFAAVGGKYGSDWLGVL